jgi:hypothetical protein
MRRNDLWAGGLSLQVGFMIMSHSPAMYASSHATIHTRCRST